MYRVAFAVVFAVSGLSVSPICGQCLVLEKTLEAKAILEGQDSGVSGTIFFIQKLCAEVLVSGTITGLSPGLHGFHVHEKGNITGGCDSAGPHFNPDMVTHGGPSSAIRHVGDLGNVEANIFGVAQFVKYDGLIKLASGQDSIVDRTIVIHSGKDDFGKGGTPDSLTSGNSGQRVACGIIRLVNPN